MGLGLYGRWMVAWETALTTRDQNRVERPLEWGFDHLSDAPGLGAAALAEEVSQGRLPAFEAMREVNRRIVADPHTFYDYVTPIDFRVEQRHPELFPTNVRPETLAEAREWRRRADVGELRREPFLRFTSPVRTPYPENDLVNARWYEAPASSRRRLPDGTLAPKQALIVMPQWNADAFSHNALCDLFLRWGISSLRLSKPYHDIRRPAELERSDFAVSANIGRTLASARQAVADIRSSVDWLVQQGYEQIGVLGTSLGSCYGYLAAALDSRLSVCAFNHASTSFGDVVWEGQSTRHVRSALEGAGLSRQEVRDIFAAISPANYVEAFAATRPRKVLIVYATYDLTFPLEFSKIAVEHLRSAGVDYEAKVLPCGHYTTGEWPFKYLDGWYLGSFIWKSFRALAGPAALTREAVPGALPGRS